jgi:hypothetical protein
MLGRRRPLLRAAMVGGAGYVAGRNLADRRQHEAAQDEEMYELRQAQSGPSNRAAPGPSSASSVSERADALTKLKGLLDSGVLTQEEFDTQKRKILEEG